MDTGCFTAAQRLSCHTMNADLLKPGSERAGAPQSSAPGRAAGRSKAEQNKPELAQVVTDSKTGRSYSKGKLLGKVGRLLGSHVRPFLCVCRKLRVIKFIMRCLFQVCHLMRE